MLYSSPMAANKPKTKIAEPLKYEGPNRALAEEMIAFLRTATYEEACDIYATLPDIPTVDDWLIAQIAEHDRFFLLTHILRRPDALDKWLYLRTREVEHDRYSKLDLWAREHYKDICNMTNVVTPTGWRHHGELAIGDEVFSPEGKPIKVLATTEVFTDSEMYRLSFADSQDAHTTAVHAGAGHLWDVEFFCRKRIPGTKNGRVGWTKAVLNTKAMLPRTQAQQSAKSPRWYRVKVAGALEYPEKVLPIPPYTLGAWLGDGTCGTSQISNADDQLWDRVRAEGSCVGDKVRGRTNTQTRTVYGLIQRLRGAGLASCTSSTKHLPGEYQTASLGQRTALIQGLMDTDGSVTDRGDFVYTTTSEALARDVKQLLSSLGVLASMGPYQFDREGTPYTYYKVQFVPNAEVAFFSLDYHKARITKKKPKVCDRFWYLKDIQPAPTVPSKCIQVEGGRYVVGEQRIPTRNSTIITFAGTFQEIIEDPEVTIGIFSCTRPIAKAFLDQIKSECELNPMLHRLWPHIFWGPKEKAPTWGLDSGLLFKRKGNPKERSVEAWGIVDGQPTALAVDTPVLTTTGWKPHGDLAVGDFVYNAQGSPVQVIHNTGPMVGKKCYRVTMDDTDIVAAEDHLWPVDRVISPRDKLTGKQNTGWAITEREIVKTKDLPLSGVKNRDKRRRLLRTPSMALPAQEEALPLDPYIFGLWLGDGSSDTGIITTADSEMLQGITAAGFTYVTAQDRGSYGMYRLSGLRETLKAMGQLGDKHIPDRYLYGSEEERLALLQGLMDSDGSCHSNGTGQSIFTNTRLELIDGVHFLAASLGMKPGRTASYWDGHPKHKTRYTVSFLGTKETPPFRLSRKLARCKDRRHKTGRYVRALDEVESVPVNCIQVLSEDGLYLAGRALVPTHNSKHFKIRLYDDVVTAENVGTPEMIHKTTERLELSFNLGTRESEGGREIYAGTRYAFGDTYQTLKDRGVIIPREHPATHDGTFDGKPVFLTQQEWDNKKQGTSRFTIACLAAGTRILMADWTQKPIEAIEPGDKVVGVQSGANGKAGNRTKLASTTILATGHRMAEVVRYTFASGKQITATPDHKWWTGRPPQALNDSHRVYASLGLGYHELSRLCRIVDPDSGAGLTPEQQKAAYWLGGMFDGEGSTSGDSGSSYVHITQCPRHNPETTQALREAYTLLDFDWEEYKRKDGKSASVFRYRGGRRENFRFLQMCDPVKRFKIAKTMFGSRIGYQNKEGQDALVSIEAIGRKMVYSLTTATGNYVAEGCVSKNCQQLLNPIAGSEQTFDPAHLRMYEVRPTIMNVYILVDPANSKKKGSNKTAMVVIGVDTHTNKYVLDGICHQMKLSERWVALKALRTKWLRQPGVQLVKVGYEKYGMQTDIEHFQEMMKVENAHFEIIELSWTKDGLQSKVDRVQRLQPDFENWRLFIPYNYETAVILADLTDRERPDPKAKGQPTKLQGEAARLGHGYRVAKAIRRVNQEGQAYDVVHFFIYNEYLLFPSIHPDFLDAMSRIYDIGIAAPQMINAESLEPAPEPAY